VSENRAFIDKSAVLRLLVKDDLPKPGRGKGPQGIQRERYYSLPDSGRNPGDRVGYGEGISAQQKGHQRARGSDPEHARAKVLLEHVFRQASSPMRHKISSSRCRNGLLGPS